MNTWSGRFIICYFWEPHVFVLELQLDNKREICDCSKDGVNNLREPQKLTLKGRKFNLFVISLAAIICLIENQLHLTVTSRGALDLIQYTPLVDISLNRRLNYI